MCDMCNGMTRKQLEALIDQRIRDYGHEVIFVESDRISPSLAYTVGLSRIGHPEFLVRGLDMDDSIQMLNGFSASVLEWNEVFAHGHTGRWKDGTLLYFSKISTGIRKQVPLAYQRYGESLGLLEVLLVGRDIPNEYVVARHN